MRPDGKLVKNEDPMYYLIPHFLKKRYDAQNMLTLNIPEEPLRRYAAVKRKEGKTVSHLAIVLTAYLRMLEKYPAMNRFIMRRRIYQRNEISVAMAVLKAGGEDTIDKIYLQHEDNIFSVQDKIDSFITNSRRSGEATSLDKWMNRIVRMNGLMGFFINLVTFLDKLGLLPKKLIDVSPFHASMLITNLASIRTNHIYHHIYEFGTTSMSIAMGNLREVPRRGKDGIVFDRCIPFGIVLDERIANGHYMASAFAEMKTYLKNPELLEAVPECSAIC